MPEPLWELTSSACPGFTFQKRLNICRETSPGWRGRGRAGNSQCICRERRGWGWGSLVVGGEGGRTGRFFSSLFLSPFLQDLGGPQRLRIFQPLQDKLGLPKAVTSFHNTELPLPVCSSGGAKLVETEKWWILFWEEVSRPFNGS